MQSLGHLILALSGDQQSIQALKTHYPDYIFYDNQFLFRIKEKPFDLKDIENIVDIETLNFECRHPNLNDVFLWLNKNPRQ